jgi:hypothetical protein
LDFTREGFLQPWARLRSTEPEERNRLEALPKMDVINEVRGIKPGASVVLSAKDKSGKAHPALVVQRFGQGRTGVLAVGDLWRTGLQDENTQKDLAKFWRQIGRWLTTDVPEKIEVVVQPKASDADQAVELVVRARNKKFQPLENATIKLSVTAPGAEQGTNVVTIPAEASTDESGVYRATYIPRVAGAYTVSAKVIDEQGIDIGEKEGGWTSDPLAEEFKTLAPNRALLEAIAKKTGGEVVELADIEKFVDTLPAKKAPIIETHSLPLWHEPLVFLVALGALVAEWGIRRWKGLA